jgi:DNA-binding CsgD family transcriptional regulator
VRLLAGTADASEAMAAAVAAGDLIPDGLFIDSTTVVAAQAMVALIAGEVSAAAVVLRAWVARWPATDSVVLRSDIMWLAAWAAMAMAEAPGTTDRGDDLADIAERALAETAPTGAFRPGADPQRELAGAYLARRAGNDDPALWAAAASTLEGVSYVPLATFARLGEAEAHLRAGAREPAGTALRAAAAHAGAMGATAFRDRAERLARAGRLGLDDAPAGPAPERESDAASAAAVVDPWGLSPRELEVLALVADGRTNAQIGEALFISDKTASVHVTHILDKLGVSSRVEAALAAVRAGIVTGEPPG